MHAWLDAVIDGPVAKELTATGGAARRRTPAATALGQKLLALTVPGVPDVYQGTELWEDSLVDPDNRRPVDYAARRARWTALSHPKMRVVTAALRLRRDRPDTFLDRRLPAGAGRRCGRRAPGRVPARRRRAGRGQPLDGAPAETGWGDTVSDRCPTGAGPTGSPARCHRHGRRPPTCSPSCPSRCWSSDDG